MTVETTTGETLGGVLLYVDDEPAACALVSITDDVAGIYNVATLPEFRRRGLGATATWEAIRIGVERGCATSVLQASPMGAPVYRRMGFHEFGRYVKLEAPPVS